jgi:ankyrin repeat protein
MAAGVTAGCSGRSERNIIMGTGVEKTHVSAMTEVDKFHDAIRRNDVAAAMKLLPNVDKSAPDRMGTPTIVLVARYTDSTDLLDALKADAVDAADTLKRTALSWAASANHREIAEALIRRGASLETRDMNGRTPLFHAVLADARDTTRLLVEHKANVDARDAVSDTPLMLAAAKGNGAMVELLLSAGADKGAVGSNGRTAAMRASREDVKRVLGE